MASPNKREDILSAALILFSERGYDGTTIPMIAERANVGAGTIYRYFENKEYMVNILFQECLLDFSESMKKVDLTATMNLKEKFYLLFNQMITFAKAKPEQLNFFDTHCTGYYLDDKSKKLLGEYLDFLTSFIEEGKKSGVIQDLPSDALISIIYGAFSHLFKLIHAGLIEESPHLLESLVDCCWNAIKIH
ncbi:TetR family transcriptional regulator [Pradoshia eiseniae]|uniref:TetR family transcriptional regulator n=1 Tax=Pradoshia eiseniae TaxID=2064768 RepID=A0A2S7N3C7_9BACI|nr:TetR/AcrR family transcriptional regulator [Pradoshia eiseniae]PQD96519.1 TetR family transcriptional regulator [Pradoshia eiseniae]